MELLELLQPNDVKYKRIIYLGHFDNISLDNKYQIPVHPEKTYMSSLSLTLEENLNYLKLFPVLLIYENRAGETKYAECLNR